AARRSVPRAALSRGLRPLSSPAVGCGHRAQAARARRHLREAREPRREPALRAARAGDHRADRHLHGRPVSDRAGALARPIWLDGMRSRSGKLELWGEPMFAWLLRWFGASSESRAEKAQV